MSLSTTTRASGRHARVNLLPPEVEQRTRQRRARAGMGAVVLLSAAAVGAGYYAAVADARAAQRALADSQARQRTLQGEEAKYAEVPATYAAVDRAEAQLAAAMGPEIRWSYYLRDLGLTTPDNVWFTNMTAAMDVPGATAAPAQEGAAVPGAIGSVSFTGRALAQVDVAAWLEALAKQRGYTNPYFSESTKHDEQGQEYVEFRSSVAVTDQARSQRFTKGAGRP